MRGPHGESDTTRRLSWPRGAVWCCAERRRASLSRLWLLPRVALVLAADSVPSGQRASLHARPDLPAHLGLWGRLVLRQRRLPVAGGDARHGCPLVALLQRVVQAVQELEEVARRIEEARSDACTHWTRVRGPRCDQASGATAMVRRQGVRPYGPWCAHGATQGHRVRATRTPPSAPGRSRNAALPLLLPQPPRSADHPPAPVLRPG